MSTFGPSTPERRSLSETELSYLQTRSYPPVRYRPCDECPWLRDSEPGHLGPTPAEEWCDIAHSEAPIACHLTIVRISEGHGDWDDPAIRQCAGAAIYRANISKTPRNPNIAKAPQPDYDRVFAWDDEFISHHTQE